MTAPTTVDNTTENPGKPIITQCQLDARSVSDGHCSLTTLDQLQDAGRNSCPNFTQCETKLRQTLSVWGSQNQLMGYAIN